MLPLHFLKSLCPVWRCPQCEQINYLSYCLSNYLSKLMLFGERLADFGRLSLSHHCLLWWGKQNTEPEKNWPSVQAPSGGALVNLQSNVKLIFLLQTNTCLFRLYPLQSTARGEGGPKCWPNRREAGRCWKLRLYLKLTQKRCSGMRT